MTNYEQEAGFLQASNLPVPLPWTFWAWQYEKSMSFIYKLPTLWCFVIAAHID